MKTHEISVQSGPFKYLHIGDLHLSSALLEDQTPVLDFVVMEVQRRGIRVVVVGGDLAGEACPHLATPREREVFRGFIRDIKNVGAQVMVVRGNHDVPEDWMWLRSIPDVIYATTPESVLVNAGSAKYMLHLLPYPDRSWVAAFAEDSGDATQRMEAGLAAIMVGFEAARLLCDGVVQSALIGHMNHRGAVTSTGQPLIGTEVELPAELIVRSGCALATLSHIHMPQAVTTRSGARVVHVGSPWPTSFGEVEDKRVLVVEFDGKDVTETTVWTPHIRRWTLDMTWDGTSWAWTDGAPTLSPEDMAVFARSGTLAVDVVDSSGAPAEWWKAVPGELRDLVRIKTRLRYAQEQTEVINFADVQRMFPGARSVRLDRMPVITPKTRAPEVVAARGVRSRFIAFEESHGRSVRPGSLVILDALTSAGAHHG